MDLILPKLSLLAISLCLLLCVIGSYAQTTQTAPGTECVCSCLKNTIPVDQEERQKLGEQEAEKIKEVLEVDKKALSATIRKKKSAEDDRPSAKNVGYLGIAMLVLSMVLILFMDINYIIKIGHTLYWGSKQLFSSQKTD